MIKQLMTSLTLLTAASNEFSKGALPLRPQEPKGARPYDEEEVTYSNVAADVSLSGTFTLPRS